MFTRNNIIQLLKIAQGPTGWWLTLVFLLLVGATQDHLRSFSTPLPLNLNRPSYWVRLKILNCHDGDTCQARNARGVQLTLRLLGIDAPEIRRWGRHDGGQSYAREARDYLIEGVQAKTFWVFIKGGDRYRRYLALLFPNSSKIRPKGENAAILRDSFNHKLLRQGLAYSYRGRNGGDQELQQVFNQGENEGRVAKRGFWGRDAIRPEDPSLFRHRKD